MRKLGKRIEQKGTGKTIKKKSFELLTDLTNQRNKNRITKKELAKKLGISDRTLRSYTRYMANESGIAVEINKNDRKPPKDFINRLRKVNRTLPKKQRKASTRQGNNIFDKDTKDFKEIITQDTYEKIQHEMNKKTFFGFLIRVNVNFYTRNGVFEQWLTFVYNVKQFGNKKEDIDKFVTGAITKKARSSFQSTENYKLSGIFSFEIIETVIDITVDEFENEKRDKKAKKKTNYHKQIRSGKKSRKNKK